MTVNTGGQIRGFVGRWLMRIEAAGNVLRMAFLGVTAASTLTSALALIGHETLAPYVLGAGIVSTLLFAWAYVELGVYNRKNRERAERGNNFSRPDMRIDDELIAAGVFAAVHGRPPEDEEEQAIEETLDGTFNKYRNGVEIK